MFDGSFVWTKRTEVHGKNQRTLWYMGRSDVRITRTSDHENRKRKKEISYRHFDSEIDIMTLINMKPTPRARSTKA